MPQVSVIISSFNHANFIGLAIESVLNQQFQDFEILIADDASTDHTKEVVVRYLNDSRIKFFPFEKNREEHMKNFCLQKATGKYISILNSDDLFHPSKLASQINYLEANPTTGAVFTLVEWIDENGDKIVDRNEIFTKDNKTRAEWLRHFFLHGNCFCHSSVVYRKEMLSRIGEYNRWLAQLSDFDMWIKIALEMELYVYPEVLTYNRLLNSEKNASGNRPEVANRSYFEHIQVLDHYASDKMLELLPSVFSEVDGIATANLLKRKGLFAQMAMSSNHMACRYFGLTTYYSIITSNTASVLESIFGANYRVDFYKHTSNTLILTIADPILELAWYSNQKKIMSTSVIITCREEKTISFSIPKKEKDLSYTLSFLNVPYMITISAMVVGNKEKIMSENIQTTISVEGVHYKNFHRSTLEIISEKMPVMLTGNFDFETYKDASYLKIQFQLHQEKGVFRVVEHELNQRVPILIENQNLEDISAKRLLSSLVKKLLKRIK